MLFCPFGVPGFGELPLNLGVLDSFVRGVCWVFLATLDELLLDVLELEIFSEYFPFLLILPLLGVVDFWLCWFAIIFSNRLFLWLTPSFLSSTSIWVVGIVGHWKLVGVVLGC